MYATIAFYVVWALPISCVLLLVSDSHSLHSTLISSSLFECFAALCHILCCDVMCCARLISSQSSEYRLVHCAVVWHYVIRF